MSQRNEHVLLFGNGPILNRGCEAILRTTIDLIHSVQPECRLINCSAIDTEVQNRNNLKFDHVQHTPHPPVGTMRWFPWQLRKKFLGHEFNFERFLPFVQAALALGGDNYSMDYGTHQIYYRANERVLRSGVPLILWGSSIGPFNEDPEFERLVMVQLKKAHRIVVRETLTQQYLADHGVRDNVVVLPDPAFNLEPEVCELPNKIIQQLQSGCIGVNISPLLGRYRTDPEAWLDEASSWVKAIMDSREEPILMIPHVTVSRGNDQDFMQALVDRIDSESERITVLDVSNLSTQHVKYVISRCKVFVGARTHSTIAALSSAVPTLSIGYSIKAKGINHDVFGDERWLVDHKQMTADTFAAKVAELIATHQETREDLRQRMAEYVIEPQKVADILP